MFSFSKLLKLVLPLGTGVSATAITVSLISFINKNDPAIKELLTEKVLSSFETLTEDFKEKTLFYSEEGEREEADTKEIEKAEQAIKELKQEASKGEPAFKTKEEAIQFLNQFPQMVLSELLKKSKLTKEDLSRFKTDESLPLGKFGKAIDETYPSLGDSAQPSPSQKPEASNDNFSSSSQQAGSSSDSHSLASIESTAPSSVGVSQSSVSDERGSETQSNLTDSPQDARAVKENLKTQQTSEVHAEQSTSEVQVDSQTHHESSTVQESSDVSSGTAGGDGNSERTQDSREEATSSISSVGEGSRNSNGVLSEGNTESELKKQEQLSKLEDLSSQLSNVLSQLGNRFSL